ncbi:MAG: hypothetical protein NC399_07825 [Muribaculum sp.]|nr:hypothetical protein [Muribaculum sp.]
MIFKCQNCGGNVVYSPERHKMFCPYCESEESQEATVVVGVEVEEFSRSQICPDCGGEIPLKEHTSATQCPYCGNYLILEQRMEGEWMPKVVIPFELGKESCKKSLREKFSRNVFAPTDFLSEARLDSMAGNYVPFWFYDYDVNVDYQAEGTRVQSWTSGNMHYTETSYYDVRRNLDIAFQDIPVDASVDMPDDVMDLMEPYDYKQMIPFEPKYLSGFAAERYNMGAAEAEGRAKKKMTEDSNALLNAQVLEYSSLRAIRNDVRVQDAKQTFGLLPVWKYLYRYAGKEYPFYVNGQTGKIVGTAPTSVKKVLVYTGTLWGSLMLILGNVMLWALLLVW